MVAATGSESNARRVISYGPRRVSGVREVILRDCVIGVTESHGGAARPEPQVSSTSSPTARISASALLRVTGPGFMW